MLIRGWRVAAAVMWCVAGWLGASARADSGTAFTYQGDVSASGQAVNGAADFQFRLYDAATAGALVGSQVAASNVTVVNGKFTVLLDFGWVFAGGQARWLEVDARTPAGSGAFTTLSPRQPVSPSPMAQGLAGIVITPAGSVALDQNQSAGTLGFVTSPNGAASWQSFTAGATGFLDHVSLNADTTSGNGPVTVTLYSGLGTSGPVIATAVATSPFGVFPVRFQNVAVSAGTVYTLGLGGSTGLRSVSAAIPGATGVYGGNVQNWWFQTYVQPEATIAAKAATASVAANAMQLNYLPGSAYLPPTVKPWVVSGLASNSYSGTPLTTIAGSLKSIQLEAGTAVVSWSTSARAGSGPVTFQVRVRIGSNVGPWTNYAFNVSNVHETISGNAVIPLPTSGLYDVSLEMQLVSGVGTYVVDQNDPITATIINIRQ